MALTDIEQLRSLVKTKKRILITFPTNGGGDVIGSAVALSLFFRSQHKQVDVVADAFTLPEKFRFLKAARQFKSTFTHLQKFIISVDVSQTGVEELSYDVQNERLRIFVTPTQGFLTKEKVHTAQSDFTYDLIITLGTPDLQSLGRLYTDNSDFFHQVPLVAIDNSPAHERYGQINILEYTATTTAEVVFDIITKFGEEHLSKRIATALLTGMIDATKSFTTIHVKPQTLTIASKLIALGGDRQHVIHNLYRTKTLASLKLWGQALIHLESHKAIHLVSTRITRDQFIQTKATHNDLYDIVDELIANSPEAKMILLLHEHADDSSIIHGMLYATKGVDAKTLIKKFNPTGDDMRASFIVKNKKLREVETDVIQEINRQIGK